MVYIMCRRSNTSWKRKAVLHNPSAAQDHSLPPGLRAEKEQGSSGEQRGKSPLLTAIPLALLHTSLVPIPTHFPSTSNEQGHLLTAPALGGEEQSTFSVIGPGLVDAESHGPGPISAAVPVGMTWEQQWAL